MRPTKLLLILAPLAPLFAVYQYYFSDIFSAGNAPTGLRLEWTPFLRQPVNL